MMKLLILFFIVFSDFCSFGQMEFEWANRTGNTSFNKEGAMTVDEAGNIYSIGMFKETLDLDPGPDTYNVTSIPSWRDDIYFQKLDPSGNFIFGLKIGGNGRDSGTAIAVDSLENIYISGSFRDTVDFDPGIDTFNLVSNGLSDAFVMKLNKFGDFLWARSFGGTDDDHCSLNSLKISNDGTIFLSGQYKLTVDFDFGIGETSYTSNGSADVFIMRIDDLGNFVWAKSFGGIDTDRVRGVSIDNTEFICISGSFYNSVDFNPSELEYTLTSEGMRDAYILKLNLDGEFIWVKQFSGINTVTATTSIDQFGNIYSTGFFKETIDFDPGPGVYELSSSGEQDIYVHKMNGDGEFIWAIKMGDTGGDIGRNIKTDSIGNVYVTGAFQGIVDFNPGAETFDLESYTFAVDGYVAKLDSSGAFKWAFHVGGSSGDDITDIELGRCGQVITSGNFQNTGYFGAFGDPFALTSEGSYDRFLLKLTPVLYESPDVPILSSSEYDTLCPGDSLELFIDSGNLNDAYYWVWYDPLCGGSIIDTGLSVTVYPSGTRTYYARGEGGCISYGLCGSVTIFGDEFAPVPDEFILDTIFTNCPLDTILPPSATDYCFGSSYGTPDILFPFEEIGTSLITWTYSDSLGNSSSQTQNIVYTPIDNSVSQDGLILTANAAGLEYQWVDCDEDFEELVGETNQDLFVTENSNYAVWISNDSCSVLSACIEINFIGLKNNELTNALKIYPNPSSGTFNINLEKTSIEKVILYDLSGKLLYYEEGINSHSYTLKTHVATGVYLIEVTSSIGVHLSKVVVE